MPFNQIETTPVICHSNVIYGNVLPSYRDTQWNTWKSPVSNLMLRVQQIVAGLLSRPVLYIVNLIHATMLHSVSKTWRKN